MAGLYVEAFSSPELTIWQYTILGLSQRAFGVGEVPERINGLAPAIIAGLKATVVDKGSSNRPIHIFVPETPQGICTKEDWSNPTPPAYLAEAIQLSDEKFNVVKISTLSDRSMRWVMEKGIA